MEVDGMASHGPLDDHVPLQAGGFPLPMIAVYQGGR